MSSLTPSGKATNATSGGGISPQQQAYADYTGAEDAVSGASAFSSSGTQGGIPIGTGETFAAGVGPAFTTAGLAAKMSDADAAALQRAQTQSNQATKGGVQSGIGLLGSAAGGK